MSKRKQDFLYAILGTNYSFKTGGSYPSHFEKLHESYIEASDLLVTLGFTPYYSSDSNDKDGEVYFCLSKLDDQVMMEEQIVKLRLP